ncbi:hypothetical protein [Streptomyces sp. NPDC029721]|uniref:hypothetical protein n=1 Tax=Streptomyces sp. NPDC029721 TaxID=3157090 RepID=UPI00340C4671
MTKLAWAARGISAATGAVLLGSLMVPSAAASGGMDHDPQHKKKGSHSQKAQKTSRPAKADPEDDGREEHKRRCSVSRDFSIASPDDIVPTIVFRVATDRQGHAFLNDTRNPGVWINLGVIDNAPSCVADTDIVVGPTHNLKIDLLTKAGVIHHTSCRIDPAVPYTPANLASFCGVGFSAVPDTPV